MERVTDEVSVQRSKRPLALRALALLALLSASGCDQAALPGAADLGESGSRAASGASATAAIDPLPSWRDTETKQAILDFVARVTTEGSPDLVPEPARIAVFDNDGTLWTEQPIYAQFAFALDRVRALAPQNPSWQQQEPFKSVLEGDVSGAVASGEAGLASLLAATHVGNTTDEFAAIVSDWLATARHPRFEMPYTAMVYQPMLELLELLRGHGFRTFIVSGGGVEFMRPWAEQVYGIPPEQIVGSRAKVEYRAADEEPVLFRLAEIDLVDDGPGKPVGIHQQIGRRPIAAFGNSDGDFEMLEWATSAAGPRLGVLVHHTDSEREWAYDRASPVGRLARGLDEAPARGWVVVDMQRDWNVIYPFQR